MGKIKEHYLAEPERLHSKTKHTLIAGLSGFGKGMFGEWYCPKFVHLGWKVFDINSESRGEGMYYSVRQTDRGFVSKLDLLSNGILKPESYDNEIVMFLGHKLRDLRKLPKNVKVCVFNEKWLTNEDLKNFIAFNDNQKQLMEAIFELHGDVQIPLSYLYEFLKNAAKNRLGKEGLALKRVGAHYSSVNAIKKVTRALVRSGLFYNDASDLKKYFHYLDLEESLKHPEKITTFSTYLIGDDYIRYICISILLKKFIEVLETRKYRAPLMIYIREGNDFYSMENKMPYHEEIQNNIAKILRKGRSLGGSEIAVVMDTQLIRDLPENVVAHFNKFVCFKLPFKDSQYLKWKSNVNDYYLSQLSTCEVGVGMIVSDGRFHYPVLFPPTSHKKADIDFDVFAYLGSVYGNIDYSESNYLKISLSDKEEEKPQFIIPSRYTEE